MESRAQSFAERFRAGATTAELAEETGLTPATIRYHLRRAGIHPRHARRGLGDEGACNAVRLYGDGHSVAEVAERLEVTAGAIRGALRRAGVPSDASRRGRRALTDRQRDEAYALYLSTGGQSGEVARAFGVSQATISRLVTERGRLRHARKVTSDGYVLVVRPDRWLDMPGSTRHRGRKAWVLEHRLVMADHLGRILTRGESVHHINGQREDNRIENLELRQPGEHGRGVVLRCADCGSRRVAPAPIRN